MYKGKEPCQGCGKTGREVSRYSKNQLCPPCMDSLKLGRVREYEEKFQYVSLNQHYFAFHTPKTEINLNTTVHKFLKSLDTGERMGKYVEDIKYSWGSNREAFSIPKPLYEPLKQFFNEMEAYLREYADKVEAESSKFYYDRKKILQEERDKIYNEGVEMGRNLLMQLESGGLSMEDFAKNLSYPSK